MYPPHPEFSNGCNGTRSGGSMNNPMYQKICALGTYEPQSGRSKQRNRLKRVMEFLRTRTNNSGSYELQKINKKVIDLLRELSDDNQIKITQNKHLKIKGNFGGTEKTLYFFVLHLPVINDTFVQHYEGF